MNKQFKLLSDYTPLSESNILIITQRNDGDIIFGVYEKEKDNRGIQIAMSGTRYSPEFHRACQTFFKAIEKEITTNNCFELKEINQ